jgi:hypothetical protein
MFSSRYRSTHARSMLVSGAVNDQVASVVMPSTAISRSRTATGSEPGFKTRGWRPHAVRASVATRAASPRRRVDPRCALAIFFLAPLRQAGPQPALSRGYSINVSLDLK